MSSPLYFSFIDCPFCLLPLSLYILFKQLRQLLISVTLTMAGGWFSPPTPLSSSTVLQMVCSSRCCRGSAFVNLTAHVTGNGGPCENWVYCEGHTVDHAVSMINTCDCHKSLEALLSFFSAPIFKLSYTQLGNHPETDLRIQGWKRESHPSGNSLLEFQRPHQVSASRTQTEEWRRWFTGSCFILYPTCLCNPPQSPVKAPPQQPRDELMDGAAHLCGWTAFRAGPWIMGLWHGEHAKCSRQAGVLQREHY